MRVLALTSDVKPITYRSSRVPCCFLLSLTNVRLRLLRTGFVQVFKFFLGSFEDCSNFSFPLMIAVSPSGSFESRFYQRPKWPEKRERFRPHPLSPIPPTICPRPDPVDVLFLTFKFLSALRSQTINFPT